MKYTQSPLYREELQNISDVLELINYRPRTIDSYLQSIFECCVWLTATYESGESPISNIVKLNPYSIAVKSEAYEEYEKTTGINEVDTAPSETERYDLTGRPIRNMRGIVIERQGSEVRKIIRK